MKKNVFPMPLALVATCLLAAGMGFWLYQTQASLRRLTQQTQTAKAQLHQAEKRKQAAQKQWEDYNRAELRAIVAQMRPTLIIVSAYGSVVKIDAPIPPVRGLRVIAYMDSVVQKHLWGEFRYEITKARSFLYRNGALVAQQLQTDNIINIASLNSRPSDTVGYEVLEMYRIDKVGKKELVEPKNPVLYFALR